MTQRILLIEDDPDIVRIVKAYLERESFQVETVGDGAAGLAATLEVSPTLIVLDWMLPHLDGEAFMKRLRPSRITPVIMLTARGEEGDRLRGFELGVDDYVSKPFSPRELVARVHAVLRRAKGEVPVPATEALQIDPLKRVVTFGGCELDLTTLEFELLSTLAAQPGRVWHRNELLDRVWGRGFTGVDRVVDVHMSNLRGKLEVACDTPVLFTVRGVGYKFAQGQDLTQYQSVLALAGVVPAPDRRLLHRPISKYTDVRSPAARPPRREYAANDVYPYPRNPSSSDGL